MKYSVTMINSMGCTLGTEWFESLDEVGDYVLTLVNLIADGDQLVFGVNDE